jgi:hypothetical protein
MSLDVCNFGNLLDNMCMSCCEIFASETQREGGKFGAWQILAPAYLMSYLPGQVTFKPLDRGCASILA